MDKIVIVLAKLYGKSYYLQFCCFKGPLNIIGILLKKDFHYLNSTFN